MKKRRGGRGRTLTQFTLGLWTLDALKTGTVMQTIQRYEYKQGYARKKQLFKSLRKKGLTDKDIQKSLAELIREGDVYTPRAGLYGRTSYTRRRKRRKR